MRPASVIYWDASAALALLFRNEHRSEEARRRMQGSSVHLLSSLAFAEIHAAVGRAERQMLYSPTYCDEARKRVTQLWQPVYGSPDRSVMEALGRTWPLRGADLWHLALAKWLSGMLPDLKLLTFDERLASAAAGEALA